MLTRKPICLASLIRACRVINCSAARCEKKGSSILIFAELPCGICCCNICLAVRRTSSAEISVPSTLATKPLPGPVPRISVPRPPGISVMTIEAQMIKSRPPRIYFVVWPDCCRKRIMFLSLQGGKRIFNYKLRDRPKMLTGDAQFELDRGPVGFEPHYRRPAKIGY